jgi:hypothetical protein
MSKVVYRKNGGRRRVGYPLLVLCAVLAYVFWKAGLFDSKEALTSCISRFGWAGPAVSAVACWVCRASTAALAAA